MTRVLTPLLRGRGAAVGGGARASAGWLGAAVGLDGRAWEEDDVLNPDAQPVVTDRRQAYSLTCHAQNHSGFPNGDPFRERELSDDGCCAHA